MLCISRLDELIETFLEDNDPDSSLDVGADMRKIKYCFAHMKVFFLNRGESAAGTLKIAWRYSWLKSVKRNAVERCWKRVKQLNFKVHGGLIENLNLAGKIQQHFVETSARIPACSKLQENTGSYWNQQEKLFVYG